jgi:arsenite oxidase small subunit
MASPTEWHSLKSKKLTRRTVLKGTSKVGVGAAGLALVGCGDVSEEEFEVLQAQVAALTDALEAEGVPIPEARPPRDPAQESPTEQTDAPPADAAPPAAVSGYPRIRVAGLADLSAGEPIRFDYPLQGQSNILIKLGASAAGGVGPEADIVAFNELCTHMGCPIGSLFNADHNVLGPCACHFTTFDLTHRGMVVLGQATENLPQVILEVEGDDIIAVGVNGIIYGYRNNLLDGVAVGAGEEA